MSHTKTFRTDQRGIVSLIMTLVMMIIISLIVLGLAQMSRREQRQSLDNQLSLQAFYAAESGVNDAVAAAQKYLATNSDISISNDNCNPTVGNIDLSTINVSAANNVAYTCVLVSSPGAGGLHGDLTKPIIWPLQLASGGSISSAKFSWTQTATPAPTANWTACPSAALVGQNKAFANVSNWNQDCPYGVVRIDLVPVSTVGQQSLIENTMTAFLVPTSSGGTASTGFKAGGSVYPAVCDGNNCSLTITGLGTKYYVRAIGIYNEGELTVTTPSGSFAGAQITVDATGKAQDVLRRIKESVNINTGNTTALGSQPIISGDSVCKRWAIYQDSSINASSGANSVGECN
jgi:type II secretory pathway pseudopilin PulG